MKGLDALKEMTYCDNIWEREDLAKVIEKELKRLEEFDIMYSNCVIKGAKQNKVLEIIKPYIEELIGCNVYDKDFKEYFIETKYGRKLISKETYELLREVTYGKI